MFKTVIGFLIVVAFVFFIGILAKKLLDSILDFIATIRDRRKDKKSSEEEVKNPDQVSDTAEKEVSQDK